MAYSESKFVIAFDGQTGDLNTALAALKSSFRTTVSELQSTASRLELFGKVEEQGKVLDAALTSAKAKFADLKKTTDELAKSGFPKAAETFTQALKDAEAELKRAQTEFDKNNKQVEKHGAALKAAGVDTKNFAGEQERLAIALKEASNAQLDQNNRSAIGLKTMRDIQPQLNQINAAYTALMSSGKLSFGEQSLAAQRYGDTVKALKEQTGTLGTAFASARSALIGFTVAFAAVGAAVVKAAADYRAFEQGIAAVGTIADVSDKRLGQMGDSVRMLARTMGIDAVNATKALYDIIGSGIPEQNAITVLELASKAAIAGITDVATASKVGVSIMNAYGLQVTDLGRIYDILFRTVRDGVVTFPELAANIGEVLPTARSAKVSLEQVGAAMVVLTRNGIPAAEATTSLTRTIQDLAAPAPEAKQKMLDLGITFDGLSGTIGQFATKALTLNQLRELIPDVRAVKGVQILMQNYQLLRDEIGEVGKNAATMQEAYARMAATPQAEVDRFNASLKDLSISVGKAATSASDMIQTLTGWLNAFNALPAATKSNVIEIVALTAAAGAFYLALVKFGPALNLLASALMSNVPVFAAWAQGVSASAMAMNGFKLAVAGFAGFELGKWFYDGSASVRGFGDSIGIGLGAISAFGKFLGGELVAAFTLNGRAAAASYEEFKRNLEVLNEMDRALQSGSTERLRELGKQFEELGKKMQAAKEQAQGALGMLQTTVSQIASSVKMELDATDTLIVNLNSRLAALQSKLQENITVIKTLGDAAIAQMNAEAAAKIAALDRSNAAELGNADKILVIYKDLYDKKLAQIGQNSLDVQKAFAAEALVREETAKRTAGNLKVVEQQILQDKRAILQQIVDAYRAHVNDLQAQANAHADRLKGLEEQRRLLTLTVEERIREAMRETMTASQQYSDKKLEIDQLLSRARKAVQDGDLSLAEEYATRAMGLTGGISKAVELDGRTVISSMTAQTNAVGSLKEAQNILLGVIDQRKIKEETAASAISRALKTAREELTQYESKLKDVAELSKAGLEARITANVAEAIGTIEDLEKQITERARIMQVKANVDLAMVEVGRLKDEIDRGVTANTESRIAKIKEGLAAAMKDAPELQLKNAQALGDIEVVRAAINKLSEIIVQIKTNVDAVRTEIGTLNGANTSSTHTIYVKKVEVNAAGGFVGTFATGGMVGALMSGGTPQRFAGGGPVFRRPAWSKVPGSGNQDTVPALLQEGSYVVKKSASGHYGDALMGLLARGYAGGGNVLSPGDIADRFFSGNRMNPAFFGTGQGPAPTPTPWAQVRVQSEQTISELIASAVGLPPAIWGDDIRNYMSRILERIRSARTYEDAKAIWDKFAIDVASIRVAIAQSQQMHVPLAFWGGGMTGPAVPNQPLNSAPNSSDGWTPWMTRRNPFGFAAGGGVGDSVPAMLTPGEWVIPRNVVRMLGGGLLSSINNMRLPREFLANISMGMLPPVRRFATGGPVPGADIPVRGSAAAGGVTLNLTINAQRVDEAEVRRSIIPAINRIMKASR